MPVLKDDLQEGRISRREFLRYATLLGVSTTAAYKIANVVNNGEPLLMQAAQAANIPKGGVLKVAYPGFLILTILIPMHGAQKFFAVLVIT
ncbi:MAG: hypothetical protein CM1200mP39_25400 [Dehalococcoidia bacterium]|nr:MAG: hypothetical protein CM1200mP39_25400 [Dehalococcoidia bacterium]